MAVGVRSGLTIAGAVLSLAAVRQPIGRPSEDLGQVETLTKIRQEALLRTQVVDLVGWIADAYGPRVTGSPAMRSASEWARTMLSKWGLENVNVETFPFGTEWTARRFTARMIEPYALELIGAPRLWTKSTAGVIRAEVVIGRPENVGVQYEAHNVEGRIVLSQPPRAVNLLTGAIVLRMTPELLAEAAGSVPVLPPVSSDSNPSVSSRLKVRRWAADGGALAALDRGDDETTVEGGQDFLPWKTQRTDGGTVFPGVDERTEPQSPPAATLAAEHYNLLHRLVARGAPVRMELEIDAQRRDTPDAVGRNTVGEIRGGDLAQEIVMLGAHLDSTHGATGATDNAIGVGVCLEVMRILREVGAKPRRTIRVALWDGEEQGLMGSRAYVKRHLAQSQDANERPQIENVYAYFNLDNGAGRVRGVWAQGNLGAMPLLADWLSTVSDLGAGTVGRRSVGGSDHLAFESVGVPGFQFMQDRLEYNSRSHHSTMDLFDRIQPEDAAQMVAAVAAVVYSAANDSRPMARKGLPARLRPPAPIRWGGRQ